MKKNISTATRLQTGSNVRDTGRVTTQTGGCVTDYHLLTCLFLFVICREKANSHVYGLDPGREGWMERFEGL